MIELSNSKMKILLECESKFYHTFVAKDLKFVPSEAMSNGSLLDAMVTKGFVIDPQDKPNPILLKKAMASTYGDGSEHVDNLLQKNGSLYAGARHAVGGGLRLLADPTVQLLLKNAKCQETLYGEFCGMKFSGTPDIITSIGDTDYIIDVKKTCGNLETWTEVEDAYGKKQNRKVMWYEAYDYWMQLALYKHLLGSKRPVRTGLLSASEETPSHIGLDMLTVDIENLRKIWTPYIDRIKKSEKDGWVNLGRCEACEFCRSTSKIKIGEDVEPLIRQQIPLG